MQNIAVDLHSLWFAEVNCDRTRESVVYFWKIHVPAGFGRENDAYQFQQSASFYGEDFKFWQMV